MRDEEKTKEQLLAEVADLRVRVAELEAASLTHLGVEEDRDRLARALDQAGDSVAITDTNGVIQYVNPAFERLSGYRRDEAIGRTPRLLKSGKQGEDFYRLMWETVSRGEVFRARFVNMTKAGEIYEVDQAVAPIREAGGQIISYVAVGHDVTREAQLEAEIRHAQKMTSIGRLAGGVAHEFNNLLTTILGYARLIQDQLEEGDPMRADVQDILHSGERAAQLTRRLLTFGRRHALDLAPMNLNLVLLETHDLLRRTLGEDIELISLPDEGTLRIQGDPAGLQQVILNLAVNAREAMPHGGKLTIETSLIEIEREACAQRLLLRPGPHVLLTVRDSGIGMPAEVVEHAFEPFFTTKELSEGAGLGLSTAYGIIQQCKGHIELHSVPGEGTEIRIFFPSLAGIAIPTAPSADVPGGSETILVVEDDSTVRRLAVRMLKGLGYQLLEARHGGEALTIVERHPDRIDLVLSDIIMPQMGGPEFITRLQGIRSDFAVLFMTGFADKEVFGDNQGANGYPVLPKPYSRQVLASKVREVLNTPRGA